jgi:lipopolysaccharide transport system ATP-binding protein
MSDVAIRVEGLGKRYRLGAVEGQAGYKSLRESLVNAVHRPFDRLRNGPMRSVDARELWALRDVSFEVRVGEVLGIIGRNGAGKSTLLKVLSRITRPSTGYADVYGRVGALLEVGTGFHAELTGRENIFLNGTILGMSKGDILSRFDEIVAFAELERFLDTPVKRYSSGMIMRLAFSVAAHLEPDVLVVDEILAVGDAEFQKKCLGKIDDVARHGRTVLFVSHNMHAVKSLCQRALHLSAGQITMDSDASSAIEHYLLGQDSVSSVATWEDPQRRPGDESYRLVAVRVLDDSGTPATSLRTSRPILVELEFDLLTQHSALCVGFDLATVDGTCVFRTYHTDVAEGVRPRPGLGRNVLRCTIPPGLLNAGTYAIQPRVGLHFIKWIVYGDSVAQFDVLFDHGDSPFLHAGSRPGPVAPILAWSERTADFA